MINILIDTNIILQEGFESRQMQILRRLVQGEKVQVYIPEIVKREFLTKKSSDISSDIHSICKKLDNFQKTKLFHVNHDNRIHEISKYIKSLSVDILESFSKSFEDWSKKLEAIIVDVDPSCIENVLDDYFSGSKAFRKAKSREDFPDSFIMYAIYEVLEECDDLYVVIKDGHFKKCLDDNENITTSPSLKELFTIPILEESIIALDAESDRIQSVKSFMATEECREMLTDFIYSEHSALSDAYFDEDNISDPDSILGMKLFSVLIEGIDLDEIDDINFGKINFLGDETYSIDCSFTALVTLHFSTDYGDYIHLEESRRKNIAFLSTDGEVCELEETVVCNFVGNIELIVIEKLKSEELAIHFQYLQDEKSPIITDPQINDVIIKALI